MSRSESNHRSTAGWLVFAALVMLWPGAVWSAGCGTGEQECTGIIAVDFPCGHVSHCANFDTVAVCQPLSCHEATGTHCCVGMACGGATTMACAADEQCLVRLDPAPSQSWESGLEASCRPRLDATSAVDDEGWQLPIRYQRSCDHGPDPLCEHGPLAAGVALVDGAPALPYSGPATVRGQELGVLWLQLDDDVHVTISYRTAGHWLPVAAGQDVHAFLDVERPFWSETALVLREPDQPNEPGALLAALWETAGWLPPVDELRMPVFYEPELCPPSRGECGLRTGLVLRVTTAPGEFPAVVVPGTELVDSGLRMANAVDSRQYASTSQCADVPLEWFAGYILAKD